MVFFQSYLAKLLNTLGACTEERKLYMYTIQNNLLPQEEEKKLGEVLSLNLSRLKFGVA